MLLVHAIKRARPVPKPLSGSFELIASDSGCIQSQSHKSYLRYYLIKVANSVKNHDGVYSDFYYKKLHEVSTHQHKRELALTSCKLIRLIFGLLDKN